MNRFFLFFSVFFVGLGSAALGAPPSDLLGLYLYFEEGPDDYLLFIDASNGEERSLTGEVDPFSYTYVTTGSSNATIVVTFDPVDGDYDEWDLSFTGESEGTYVRREYKDNALRDTDTGRFVENSGVSGPPVDLIGVRLEEAVQLEDERFEFLTDTDGREYEPGDIDPFTYTYSVTGLATATLVATRIPGNRWDELNLEFDTDTTGSYQLARFRDGVLKDEKRGNFRLAQNSHTVDAMIGFTLQRLSGDDFFNLSGRNQTRALRIPKGRTRRAFVEIENDGNDDTVSLISRGKSRVFRTVHNQLRPRRNVTGQIIRRGVETELEHEENERIEVRVTSRTRSRRGRLNLRVGGTSRTVRGANDLARLRVLTRG